MSLFQINGAKLSLTRPTNFNQEKEIQALIEKNLETVFNCRFIASEFSTGSEHAGGSTRLLCRKTAKVYIGAAQLHSENIAIAGMFR
jgi:hypothetical protein